MFRIRVSAVLCLLWMIAPLLYALDADRQDVMHVNADTADINQLKHLGIYTGHVRLTQGTTELQAAQAETRGNEKNQLIAAIARGDKTQQAHYSTMPRQDEPILHAYADEISYYPKQHLIILKGKARVIQGKQSFSAARISYDTLKKHVVSDSDETTRTTLVIYPEKNKL